MTNEFPFNFLYKFFKTYLKNDEIYKNNRQYHSDRKDEKYLIKGKKVAIVDDVISTGESLAGLEALVKKAGGTVYKRAFVLAEGDAKNREGIIFLNSIPLL